nr:MAG TPA: hypothetical protein [Caudoviricetes sp.]
MPYFEFFCGNQRVLRFPQEDHRVKLDPSKIAFKSIW